jgi:hypothetical protein
MTVKLFPDARARPSAGSSFGVKGQLERVKMFRKSKADGPFD